MPIFYLLQSDSFFQYHFFDYSSLFINASDILLYMLFNLLLANITILLCFFFLFCVVFNNFVTNAVETENARLKLALAFPGGAPVTVANDPIEMLPLAADKTIKDLSKYPKEANIFSQLFSHLLFF